MDEIAEILYHELLEYLPDHTIEKHGGTITITNKTRPRYYIVTGSHSIVAYITTLSKPDCAVDYADPNAFTKIITAIKNAP